MNSTLTPATTLILWTGGGGGGRGGGKRTLLLAITLLDWSPFSSAACHHANYLHFGSFIGSYRSPPPRYYQTLQLVLSVVAESQSSSVNVWTVSGLKLRDVAAESDVLRAERATSELFNIYF